MSINDFIVNMKYPDGNSGLKAAIMSFSNSSTIFLLMLSVSMAIVSPYVKHVVSRVSPGLPRLCSVLPVLALNTLAPVALNSEQAILEKVVMMFVFSWLANFKLLAFCLNRGPLVGPWTTLQLAAILNQPIYPMPHRDAHKKDDARPSGRLHDSAGQSQALLIRWLLKTALFAVVVYILFIARLSPLARDCVQVLGLYCFVGVLMDGPGAVLMHMLDFDIIPTFDQPWLSSSMADFWGRRWNIPTSHLLRVLIYDPIAEGCLVRDPKRKVTRKFNSPALRAAGMCCTFLVSGIVHEIILWACQPDGRVSWKWLIFFTMQGPLMIIENYVVGLGRARGWKLNIWVARLITLPFLTMLGHYLFLAAANTDTDTAVRVVKACHRLLESLGHFVMAETAQR